MSEYKRRDAVRIGRPGRTDPNDYVDVSRCSIIGRSGNRCDAPVSEDTKVAICDFHAGRVYRDLTDAMVRHHEDDLAAQRALLNHSQRLAELADLESRQRAVSVVYYAGNRGTIKIGRTINLKQRLMSLRIDARWLMAIEPGDHQVETQRLHQFAHLRYGRTEDFDPGDDLVAHIRAVRHQYGPPTLDPDPFGQLARLDSTA